MDHTQLVSFVNQLRDEPHETEWLEFKENHYEPQLLGEYLSALFFIFGSTKRRLKNGYMSILQ